MSGPNRNRMMRFNLFAWNRLANFDTLQTYYEPKVAKISQPLVLNFRPKIGLLAETFILSKWYFPYLSLLEVFFFFFKIKIRLQLKICHFLSSLQYSELTRNWNLIWIVSENPVLFWNIIFIMFVIVVKRNFHKNQILLNLTFSLIFYCRAARIKILSPGTVLLERWLNGFNCGWYLHFNN